LPCSSGSNISPSTFSIASLQSSDWFVTINVYSSVVPSCAVTFIFTSALSVFFGSFYSHKVGSGCFSSAC